VVGSVGAAEDVLLGQRRRFTEEHRRDAASIVNDSGQTIEADAVQLGLGE
jgi:transposase